MRGQVPPLVGSREFALADLRLLLKCGSRPGAGCHWIPLPPRPEIRGRASPTPPRTRRTELCPASAASRWRRASQATTSTAVLAEPQNKREPAIGGGGKLGPRGQASSSELDLVQKDLKTAHCFGLATGATSHGGSSEKPPSMRKSVPDLASPISSRLVPSLIFTVVVTLGEEVAYLLRRGSCKS